MISPIQKRPWRAAALSLAVPGLGQFSNGERAKGFAILCMDVGVGIGIAVSAAGPAAWRSWLATVLLGVAYLCIWIPAAVDAYQQAAGRATPLLSGENRWYMIFLLLTVGPGAIPLLWQSRRFSPVAKSLWTAAVILIALAGVLAVVIIGPAVEQWLGTAAGAFNTFP